jgi:hypothetical protein
MPLPVSVSTGGGGSDSTQQSIIDDFGVLAATADNAIKTSFATSTSPQSYSGVALNGAVGAGPLDPPRTIRIKLSNTVGAFALSAITITGTDYNDDVQTEQRTPNSANGNETLETVKTFKTYAFSFPAQADTDGFFEIGIGSTVGLRHTPVVMSNGLAPISALYIDGTRDIGFLYSSTSPVGSPPNGSLALGTTPTGVEHFAAEYHEDLS